MEIEFKHLGALAKGSVNTEKPLILMCGPNSTGKTYLSFMLNALFSRQRTLSPAFFTDIRADVRENGSFELKRELLEAYLAEEAKAIKGEMNMVFGLSKEDATKLFRSLSLTFSISDDFFTSAILPQLYMQRIASDDGILEISKEAKSASVRCRYMQLDGKTEQFTGNLPDVLLNDLFRYLSHYPIGGARMLTVERNSIYTFSKELSLTRNELIDRLLDKRPGDNIDDLMNSASQRYALAIRESLRVANDLDNIQKMRSPFHDIATQIEAELLHGCISVNKNGAVEFMIGEPGKKNRRLPIQMSSSIVKTLSSLIIYLKHLAMKGDLLIIDEPEMNLHPDMQRLLSQILSQLVNKGLRLVVSTHSDYIIREFNNMVMAHQLYSQRKNKDVEPRYSKDLWLDPRKMEVLYFVPNKKGKTEVSNLPVDKFGFNIESIDETIETQNNITNFLYESLAYGEDD